MLAKLIGKKQLNKIEQNYLHSSKWRAYGSVGQAPIKVIAPKKSGSYKL